MSLQKLAEYCDRRAEAENVNNSRKRMYWVQCNYYDKKWEVRISYAFWRNEYEDETSDGRKYTIPDGWDCSYLASIPVRNTPLEAEADTEEEAIQKLAEALGL